MEPLIPYLAAGFGALASVLLGIAVSQLKSQGRTQSQQGQSLVRIETILTGADGTNGLNGDVKKLKDWREEVEEHALPRRVTELERRWGPNDRRQHA